MARKSPLLKYKDPKPDIYMDGCGDCTNCIANEFCEGCTLCRQKNCLKDTCNKCPVRCWKSSRLDTWLQDVDGLSFDNKECLKPYKGPLPAYLPQIQNTAFNVPHSAYAINIHRLFNLNTYKWCYRKKRDLRPQYGIADDTKLFLCFCTADKLLEPIWTNSDHWTDGHSFWDGVAHYVKHQGLTGSFSIEFSCYADAPRMDHLINMKRNIISAHELGRRGVPVVLDAMGRNLNDIRRMVQWGRKYGIKWFVLNFQHMIAVPWLLDMVRERTELVLELGGNVIISGFADLNVVGSLTDRYGSRISITNTRVSMSTNYYRKFVNNQWQKITEPHSQTELFEHNLKTYCETTGMTRGLKI